MHEDVFQNHGESGTVTHIFLKWNKFKACITVMIIRLTVTFCFILSAPNLQMSRSHFILGLSKIFIFNFLKIAVIHLLKSATHIGEFSSVHCHLAPQKYAV